MLSGPKHRVAMPRSLNEVIHNQDLGQLHLTRLEAILAIFGVVLAKH